MKHLKFTKTLALTAAVSAALAVNTASGQQRVNPEGTGQVLLYPFYNTENTNDTYMHVANTKAENKAVKVRFMEHVNSEVVLEFNTYLGGLDVMALALTATDTGGTTIVTTDSTCTVPELGTTNSPYNGTQTELADGSILRTQPLVNFLYDDETNDSITRTSMGHMEVIELGVVDSSIDITDCDALNELWQTGGAWKADSSTDVTAPTGGLYGYSLFLNPEKAFSMTLNPVAIDGWAKAGTNYHTGPADMGPELDDGSPKAIIYTDGDYVEVNYTSKSNGGALATSAALAASSLSNEVLVEDTIAAETDWVFTFPTRRFFNSGSAAVAPFTTVYADEDCEEIDMYLHDRTGETVSGANSFLPSDLIEKTEACNAVSVAVFGDNSALRANTYAEIEYPYQNGWTGMSFDRALPADDAGVTVKGLPVIGFAGTRIVNDVMSYGSSIDHKSAVVASGT